jgi:ADP-ribosylglycohydrolase
MPVRLRLRVLMSTRSCAQFRWCTRGIWMQRVSVRGYASPVRNVAFVIAAAACAAPSSAETPPEPAWAERVRGMLIGTLIGDAFGGPFEFQPQESWSKLPEPPKVWNADEELDAEALAALRRRVRLRSYRHLRPRPEPYAHWSADAAPGTITDDSRHKIILLTALRRVTAARRWPLAGADLAQAYCDWPPADLKVRHPGYEDLSRDWLEEYRFAARWVLGERDPARALPPERLWASMPTCVGQMCLVPLAALFPGEPSAAYLAAWNVAWGDNGFGRDMNAGLVAGLAVALAEPEHRAKPEDTSKPLAGWLAVEAGLRQTDPLRFQKVPWSQRAVDRWLDKAARLAAEAQRRPARLFAALDKEFAETIAWEAQVPFTVVFACARLCDGDPLATLALSTEWGKDTDSYAQLAGAFAGALHGQSVFPASVREAVEQRLQEDYGEDLDAWLRVLSEARRLAHRL